MATLNLEVEHLNKYTLKLNQGVALTIETRDAVSPLTPAPLNPLRNAQWTADYLGITVQMLYHLRMSGRGPRAIRVGKYLKFRESEIMAWTESQLEPRRA